MSAIQLAATTRTEFGKGAARRIRRTHQIPAVVYGHGEDPVHITLPGHETMLALKHANVLLEIALDGGTQLAIAKDVQRDPVKNVIEHIDLLTVRQGEKVTVEVNVHVVGESTPGTIHVVETQALQVEAEATHLPESVDVSIEGLTDGAAVRAGDVTLPSGTTLLGDPDEVVVKVTTPQVDTELEAADAEAAAQASAESAETTESDEQTEVSEEA